jgi:hypothetical protein
MTRLPIADLVEELDVHEDGRHGHGMVANVLTARHHISISAQ